MKTSKKSLLSGVCLAATLLLAQGAAAQTSRPFSPLSAAVLSAAKPYQDNNGLIPPSSAYSGPLFKLNHAWPSQPLPPIGSTPWQAAINNGPITIKNAAAYADALKKAVAANARNLIMHYDTWDAAKAGWYNEPWLGSLREAIHGTYPAGEFGPGIFPNTGLRATFNTHVLTYYDARAAFTLRKLWNDSALQPNLKTENAQFDEGSIIVKAAVFASLDPRQKLNWWDAMAGAQVWPLYVGVGSSSTPQVWPGYVAQFDIIVKDSQSAPETGWVFMTLIYDNSVNSTDIWEKMVPLGAQWGNDPQATTAGMPLQ
jgi:hypothetical protein